MSWTDLIRRIAQARGNHQSAESALSDARKITISATVPPYRWTDSTRRAAWRQLVEDPNSLLLDPERAEIRNRGFRGPQFNNPVTGRTETRELSHEPTPRRAGGTNVVPRDPRDHAAIDPHRHLPANERNLTPAQRNAIREAFWNRDGYREYDPRTWKKPPTTPMPQQGSVVRGALRGVRGVGRALVPVGIALDLFSVGTEAYESHQTGNWDNTIVEGSSIAGGWGGAFAGAKLGGMAGAAIGSIFPGPGTAVGLAIGGLVGGVIGYFAGSELGETVAEEATED